MKKNDFLVTLEKELKHNGVSEVSDILDEYSQHFVFKQADGYSEDEIAARLGDPSSIAAQYGTETSEGKKTSRVKKILSASGLTFAGIITVLFYIILTACGIVLAAFSLCCIVLAFCLVFGINCYSLIPAMPYSSALLFGLAAAALAVSASVGCVYYYGFLCRFPKAYIRFSSSRYAAVSGKPVLPPLSVFPNFTHRKRRALRNISIISLIAFLVLAVAAIAISMLNAGTMGFWHVWNWFVIQQ